MKQCLFISIFFCIMGCLFSASAHVGDRIVLVYEIPDEDVTSIDLKDGSVLEWSNILPEPSLFTSDFFSDPDIGEGASYDPADLDFRIWLGWNDTRNTLWCAMERVDDVYLNDYADGGIDDIWRWDANLEIYVDGDHSGGEYGFSEFLNCPGCSPEEVDLINNQQAQSYLAIIPPSGGQVLYHSGAAAPWITTTPWADGGGDVLNQNPHLAVMEFFITPFDKLIYNDPAASLPSELQEGRVVGLQIAIPDFDSAPGNYRSFFSLSGEAATWRHANRFVDGLLVGLNETTDLDNSVSAVRPNVWGRIKATLSK